jgi:threonyl-tRNA synthetase
MKQNIKQKNNKCEAVKGFELAKRAKAENVVAIRDSDGVARDMSADFFDEAVEFIDKSSFDGLSIIRHSTAHLMAGAIQRLFPKALFTIGPSIENGFYYDIDFGKQPISEKDFPQIEQAMNKLVKEDIKFVRKEISKKEALEIFKGNKYKLEIIKQLPEKEQITIYSMGDYIDLCRGPHVPSTRYLKYFKLTKISGAY